MSKSAALQKQQASDAAEDAAPPSQQQREDVSAETNRRIVETISVVAGLHGSEKAAILLLAFIPMYLIAVAYQELNKAEPDCGTTFTWASRAFGPLVGWMGGWGIIAADVIVMANLAQIAGSYSFTFVGGLNRVGLARLAPTAPAQQTLGVAPNRTAIFWNRSGTGGELAATIFEFSLDRQTWVQLALGTRVAGTANWQVGGLSLPATGLFYIRARGIVPTVGGTSSGFYELVRQFSFSSPAPTNDLTTLEMKGGSSTSPASAASVVVVDPFTGIASRRTIIVVAGEGTVEIVAASASDGAVANAARLVNLSTRGRVGAGSPLVLGFAIVGTESRPVLLRGVGPGLDEFRVENALRATRLELSRAGSGSFITQNEGWASASALAEAAVRTGAFPLASGSADSALLVTLAPGNYTIQITDPRGTGGVALAEIYDAGTGTASRLVNVSSLGRADAGNDALISGFVIGGGTAAKVLLRAVGPGLAAYTTDAVVPDPSLTLYDAVGSALGSNDNWVSSVTTVSAAAQNSGAFSLTAGSKDAAVVATLPAGAYTIQVNSGSGVAGSALLEIYEVR